MVFVAIHTGGNRQTPLALQIPLEEEFRFQAPAAFAGNAVFVFGTDFLALTGSGRLGQG